MFIHHFTQGQSIVSSYTCIYLLISCTSLTHIAIGLFAALPLMLYSLLIPSSELIHAAIPYRVSVGRATTPPFFNTDVTLSKITSIAPCSTIIAYLSMVNKVALIKLCHLSRYKACLSATPPLNLYQFPSLAISAYSTNYMDKSPGLQNRIICRPILVLHVGDDQGRALDC